MRRVLSEANDSEQEMNMGVVGVLRFERRTSVLSGQRSNHLSYTPIVGLVLAASATGNRLEKNPIIVT